MTLLQRDAIRNIYQGASLPSPNAGWLLRRGLVEMSEAGGGEAAGTQKQGLIEHLSGIAVPKIYRSALERWKAHTSEESRFQSFPMSLENRLYIGLARDNALETGITVGHVYGMPMIPGSALKGLARSCFTLWLGHAEEERRFVFGSDPPGEGGQQAEDQIESGAVVFHDAWWVPGEGATAKPFVAEVVTPHHPDYYGSEGKTAATDFDSPIPAPQVATHGTFYFVVEGDPVWAGLAASVLEKGLELVGVGSKRTSGYGLFRPRAATAVKHS